MKPNFSLTVMILLSLILANAYCKKNSAVQELITEPTTSSGSFANDIAAAAITEIPLTLTITNPCCQEQVYFTGIIHHVENNNVIHMNTGDISGIGLTSGLAYTVQSNSVRNYQFDPSESLATLNWSMRMKREDGCGYNVQFVVHITRNANGEVTANIHSGNFFCL